MAPGTRPFRVVVDLGAAGFDNDYGNGRIDANALATNIVGAVVKDPVQYSVALSEYLETVVRTRDGWSDLYEAIREVI